MQPNYLNSSNDEWMFEVGLSIEATSICQWILCSVLCQTIDVLGLGANIINIVCFVKQGFKDPVNISLFGLTLADMGCLTTLIWTNICFTPAFIATDLPFDPVEFQYLTSGWPHTAFTRVTAWITAIITLERCLCITAPLKVKNLVTPRRVSALVIGVFIVLLLCISPIYVVNRLGMKFYPIKNKTLIGLVTTSDREAVEKISFIINNIVFPNSAFIIVIVCTITLVTKLHKLTQWRKTSVQTDTISNRNQKIAKMVVLISAIFIICFYPIGFMVITAVLEPEFAIDGKYRNIVIVCISICFILESINSSVNIFVYYYMSSKYKEIFHKLFACNA